MFEKGLQWPIGIFVSTIIVIAFIVTTVKIALENPVEFDNTLLKKQHELEKDINIYIKREIEFNKKFDFKPIDGKLLKNGSILIFKLKNLHNIKIENAQIDVTLTRPETNIHNIKAEAKYNTNSTFTVQIPSLKLEGRWNIFITVQINDYIGYFNYKADTRENESYSKLMLTPL